MTAKRDLAAALRALSLHLQSAGADYAIRKDGDAAQLLEQAADELAARQQEGRCPTCGLEDARYYRDKLAHIGKLEADNSALAAARLALEQQLAFSLDMQSKLEVQAEKLLDRLDAAEAAVAALRQDLQALVEKWRATADYTAYSQGKLQCANELADRL